MTVRDAARELTSYVLVSPLEPIPRQGRISAACPVGLALQGARSGQTVTAKMADSPERLVVIDVAKPSVSGRAQSMLGLSNSETLSAGRVSTATEEFLTRLRNAHYSPAADWSSGEFNL